MPIRVEVPEYETHVIFDDDTPPEQIQSVMAAHFPSIIPKTLDDYIGVHSHPLGRRLFRQAIAPVQALASVAGLAKQAVSNIVETVKNPEQAFENFGKTLPDPRDREDVAEWAMNNANTGIAGIMVSKAKGMPKLAIGDAERRALKPIVPSKAAESVGRRVDQIDADRAQLRKEDVDKLTALEQEYGNEYQRQLEAVYQRNDQAEIEAFPHNILDWYNKGLAEKSGIRR